MKNAERSSGESEGKFATGRRQQLEKYRAPDHAQGREAIEDKMRSYAEYRWGLIATQQFLIEDHENNLDESEVSDLKNFIKHAGKRLAVDTFHSPIFALPETATPRDAIGLQGLFAHDLTHTIAAYDRAGGKDMTPKFMKSEGGTQYTDPEVLQEEVFANLWGETQMGNMLLVAAGKNDELFFKELDNREDSLKFDRQLSDEQKGKLHEVFAEMRLAVEKADRTSQEHILELYERLTGYVLQLQYLEADVRGPLSPDDSEEQRLQNIMNSATSIRAEGAFPGYELAAKNILENYQVDNKIHFKEMQRIMGPLLGRLRRKDANKLEAADAARAGDLELASTLISELKKDLSE